MTPQPLRSSYELDDTDPIGGSQPDRRFRIFVSLPVYAENERRRILARLAGLNDAFSGVLCIVPSGPGIEAAQVEGTLGATDCDAVIAVLRPRFPDDPELAEQAGTRGGAAGLVSAMGNGGGAGLPDVYIFRYAESPEEAAADADWQSGKRAFEAWFRAHGGGALSFDDFSSADDFGGRLDDRLGAWLTGLGFEPPPFAEPTVFEPPAHELPPLEGSEPEPDGAEHEAESAAAALAREIEISPAADLDEADGPDTAAEAAVEAYPVEAAPEPEPAAAEGPIVVERDVEPAVEETMPEIEPAPAPNTFKTVPAHEESAEVVRRDRFRRLTNFLYRRQATYTPPEELEDSRVEPAVEALPEPTTEHLEAELASAEPETVEPRQDGEPGASPIDDEAAEGDDGALIVASGLVEPAAFLDELEPLPESLADAPPERPEPIQEEYAVEDDGAVLVDGDTAAPEEAAEAEAELSAHAAGKPAAAALEKAETLVEPEPLATEVLAPESSVPVISSASSDERVTPKVVPLWPERGLAAQPAFVPAWRGPRAAMLSMTALTAASLAFAVYAGFMWAGAKSTTDRLQKGFATAAVNAGNLVFSLNDEARKLGGATSEGSKSIVDAAQKLHGALLGDGGIAPYYLFGQANLRMEGAMALVKQDKLPEALNMAIDGQRLFQTLVDYDPTQVEWQMRLAASHLKIGDVLLAQNNLVEALGAYRDDVQIRKMLSAKDADNVDKRLDLAAAQIKVADVLKFRGRLEDALATYRDVLAIRKTLAQGYANNPDRQRDLMEIDNKIADVFSAQNHLDEALGAYRDSLAITAKMTVMNPADPHWREASVRINNKIGDVLVAKGRVDDALAAYRDGLATMKDVAANEVNNNEWQDDLATIHERIGDAFVTENHLESALSSYKDALAIVQAALARNPKSVAWRHAASEAQIRVGQVLFSQNNLDGSLAAHRESLNFMKGLAAEEPGNSRYQYDLMMGYSDIGIILNQKGVRAEALAAYRDAQQIATAMGAKEPNNPDWPSTRAMIDNNLGAIQIDVGNRDDGVAAYRDGLEVSKGLVARDPRNAEWQAGYAVALYNLGEAGVDTEANLTQARDLLVRLDTAGALRPDKKALIPHVGEALAKLRAGEVRKRH